jgi:molybdenum cofactor cytidylyltransferase
MMTLSQKWISLIILAAGRSTRFGSNKLLFEISGKKLIERVVETGVASKASEVVVVVGFEKEKILPILEGYQCEVVFNPEFEKGQSSSVIAGAKSVKNEAHAIMILPGDMAYIDVEHINKVIDEYNSLPSSIVVACFESKMGHPILFDRELFNEILKITEEGFGLKEVVDRHRTEIRRVDVGSAEILLDVDVPEDVKSHRRPVSYESA